jgi:hypothetical protein
MVHDAARTILLQSRPATAAPGISYNAWLVTTVVPMWIVGRVAGRCWSVLWRLGARQRIAT